MIISKHLVFFQTSVIYLKLFISSQSEVCSTICTVHDAKLPFPRHHCCQTSNPGKPDGKQSASQSRDSPKSLQDVPEIQVKYGPHCFSIESISDMQRRNTAKEPQKQNKNITVTSRKGQRHQKLWLFSQAQRVHLKA